MRLARLCSSKWLASFFALAGLLICCPSAFAQSQAGLPGLDLVHAAKHGQEVSYSLDIQTLLIITGLALLPGIILLMTPFTRIVIVLAVLRQALGLNSTPPNMIMVGLSLILAAYVMQPTLRQINNDAVQPYLAQKIGFDGAVLAAEAPMRTFMLGQTRKHDLHLYVDLSHQHYANAAAIPLLVLVPSFATSELETAFEIGFLIYIPFALIDLAVASILMSLGMIMVSPTLVSLPIKLLLFVSIGGWSLLLGSLANSFAR